MKTLKILNTLDFTAKKEIILSKDFPDTGFYFVIHKANEKSLYWVDKDRDMVLFICPIAMIPQDSIIDLGGELRTGQIQMISDSELLPSVEFMHDGKVSEDFVLKFAALFLNNQSSHEFLNPNVSQNKAK